MHIGPSDNPEKVDFETCIDIALYIFEWTAFKRMFMFRTCR